MGLVTEKTEVAYLKSLLCIVVKRHSKSLHLILSHSGIFETIILQFAPHRDVGGVVVPIVDAECLKRCPAIAMVGLSRF